MKKNIWLINHYATNTFFEKGGRHYSLAKYLREFGYSPIVICASTVHNSNNKIEIGNSNYKADTTETIPYVFVKTSDYKGNGIARLKNMYNFYKNLYPVSNKIIEQFGKPNLIIASSVHPLTLVAGIKIAKKINIPCICEVRDLWPASFSAYGIMSEKNPIMKLLYQGEKWIYKKADKIIFTMEGGKDYIIDKGWDKQNGGPIDLNKVYHINNGVDLELFNYNKENYKLEDTDLENHSLFKVIYTGSIRKANDVGKLVKIAKIIQDKGYKEIIFLIYGEGDEKENLIQYCSDNNISNVKFKGKVDKKYIPYVLSKSNLNIMHFKSDKLAKYGASLNKLFDYFASGKPILSDKEFGYDLIKRYNCGEVLNSTDEEVFAEKIIEFYNMPKEKYDLYSQNALIAAKDYDFKNLSKKLEEIIENKGGN